MKAEILCVGTELLLGDIVNTNAAFIARELAAAGVPTYHQAVVGDNDARLRECLAESFSRADTVILTGGLGPTYDDMTKETVAEYFRRKMVLDEPSLRWIEAFFKRRGAEMTPNNRKQAMMPEGAAIFHNENGTAPGLAVSDGERTAILLPGPPREMEPMFREQVMPYLAAKTGQTIRSRTIHIFGVGESAVEDRFRSRMENSKNPTLATYAKEGEVQLRVTALAPTEAEAFALTDPAVEEICAELGDAVYGVDAVNLETALVRALAVKGKTIAAAESCTGGWVAKRITDVSGASAVFGCGIVSYSNETKERALGVKPETLREYGAVSRETAAEMAEVVRRLSGADIGVSTTGVAGPEPSEGKPVGLVYAGIASESGTKVLELHLKRGYATDRSLIRRDAASRVLYEALLAVKAGRA